MFGNIGTFFGERLDTQVFKDPWGLGYTATVRRADHLDVKAWRKDNLDSDNGRMGDLVGAAALELAFEGNQQKGFRQRKKKRAKAGNIDGAKILAKVKERAGDEGILKTQGEDLEALRPGILAVYLVKLEYKDEAGKLHVATEDQKARFLLSDTKNYIPEGRDYGGQTAGDAVVEWILDCSEHAESYTEDWMEEAAQDLDITPDGTDATGQPSRSPSPIA